ncbi:MAG: hypothetical protein NTV80_16560 [Verrucomicrobia bacterium]|nr:hypothetical protein [Verrucomicrobiota bacterium]
MLSDKLQAAERLALEMVAKDELIGIDVAYERAIVTAHGHHFSLLLHDVIGVGGQNVVSAILGIGCFELPR